MTFRVPALLAALLGAAPAAAQGLHTSLGAGAYRYQDELGRQVDIFYAVVGASVSSGRASLGLSLPVFAARAAGRVFLVGDRWVVAEGGEAPFTFGLGDLSVRLSYALIEATDGALLATGRVRLPTAVGSASVAAQVDASAGIEVLKRVWSALGYAGLDVTFYNALGAAPGWALNGALGFFEPLVPWLAWGLGLSGFAVPVEQRATLDGVAQLRLTLGEAVALVAAASYPLLGNVRAPGLSLGLQTDL